MEAFLSGAGAPLGQLRGSTAQMPDSLDYVCRTASLPRIHQEVKAIKVFQQQGKVTLSFQPADEQSCSFNKQTYPLGAFTQQTSDPTVGYNVTSRSQTIEAL